MWDTIYPDQLQLGKLYSRVSTDVLGNKSLIHIRRVADATTYSGWREFGSRHDANHKCVICCVWSDEEFQAIGVVLS